MGQTILQVRIDDDLRQEATRILDKMGIDMPTAIRMFLSRVVYENGIPFEINQEQVVNRKVITYIPATPAKIIDIVEYQELIAKIPAGRITRDKEIEEYFKRKYNAKRIEVKRTVGKTDILWEVYPYWRIVSANGMLPQTTRFWSQDIQRERLEQEGLTIVSGGKEGKSLKVDNYKEYIFDFCKELQE